ncbi:hypothetical protein [Devosia sp. RR2S18]|jgi:hypothetical protein|uniref:hypothetical protein n=1 Tax=Devosia rhizosphaerae TaxID=3049774 RepID=UPI0025423EF6|nr:hypothetical protein [Devosia sp. RR2S18]WIJ23479.1 hypothetical protein QOV41_10325 [Devosia sp. RR2S18]
MWGLLKDTMQETTGLTRDALHIHIGLLIMVGAAWFLGITRWLILAWLLVVAAALGNELLDARAALVRDLRPDISDAVTDIFNTVIWPTVFLVFAKLRHWR